VTKGLLHVARTFERLFNKRLLAYNIIILKKVILRLEWAI